MVLQCISIFFALGKTLLNKLSQRKSNQMSPDLPEHAIKCMFQGQIPIGVLSKRVAQQAKGWIHPLTCAQMTAYSSGF